jgi:hypothetical protein
MNIEEVLLEISRKYVGKRQEIATNWQWEFNTPENREIMNKQIRECEMEYIVELRQKKIEHLLNDTIFRR